MICIIRTTEICLKKIIYKYLLNQFSTISLINIYVCCVSCMYVYVHMCIYMCVCVKKHRYIKYIISQFYMIYLTHKYVKCIYIYIHFIYSYIIHTHFLIFLHVLITTKNYLKILFNLGFELPSLQIISHIC